jgi:hypothetical protein
MVVSLIVGRTGLQNLIALSVRLGALLCLSSALSFAGTWSGALVDSDCYKSEERNVNPTDTSTNVDRDRNLEIRYCSPGAKTKSFAVVQQDGLSFKLDSVGDARAVELVRKTGKKSPFTVAITGEMIRNTIKVDSISIAK